MSFVPDIQNYFGKGTDFTKLSDAVSDASLMNHSADIKGDLMIDMAKGRAKQYIKRGKQGLAAGQQAGSDAAWGGAISGIGSAVMGGLGGIDFGGARPGMDTSINGVNDNPFNLGGGINGVRGGSPVDSTFGIPTTLPGFGSSSIG